MCQQVTPDQLLAFAPDAPGPDSAADPNVPIDEGSEFPRWWFVVAVGGLLAGGVVTLAARARRRAA